MSEIKPQEMFSAIAGWLKPVLRTAATRHEREFCAAPTPTGGRTAPANTSAKHGCIRSYNDGPDVHHEEQNAKASRKPLPQAK